MDGLRRLSDFTGNSLINIRCQTKHGQLTVMLQGHALWEESQLCIHKLVTHLMTELQCGVGKFSIGTCMFLSVIWKLPMRQGRVGIRWVHPVTDRDMQISLSLEKFEVSFRYNKNASFKAIVYDCKQKFLPYIMCVH